MSTVLNMHQNPRLAAALAYASIGWHVMPAWWAIHSGSQWYCACGNPQCKSPAKHPIASLAPWGQKSATTDAERIKAWWEAQPQANIAVFLEPSSLVGIDIDPRNGGLQTIDDIEASHGPLTSDLLQFTGGGGEHRVFIRPSNTTMPGKLGPGVDVKANGYLMMEPSNHISGGTYAWEASSDPRDGVMASPLPDWLRDLAAPKVPGTPIESAVGRSMPISEETKQELIEAMGAISSHERDTWIQVGMALQSIGDPNWAYAVWDAWSRQSSKYDPVDQTRVWMSFRSKGLDGITYKTIFGMAKELGTVVVPISSGSPSEPPVPVESISIRQVEQDHPVDPQLLTPPGILRDIVDWVNATSHKPQPQFAVQTALAFAAVVMGRRFCTDHGNWPALYFLNIGLSSSGKEYAKTAVERMLEACGLQGLIGPASYSSDSGMLSALHSKPNHITVIDEFHRVLETASVKGNVRSQGLMRALMECWGRSDGTMRAVGYSTVGMSAKDAKAVTERDVINPSISLLTMAIPSFWESIGSAAAKDGFLNRFLIVETSIGRQVGNFSPKVPVPQSIIDWVSAARAQYSGIVDPDSNPLGITPVLVAIHPTAMKLFHAFSAECMELMDRFERDGLAEMFGRSNEMAMKLSLILAVGRGSGQVSDQDAEWAILYVKTYALRAVQRLKTCMADSLFESAKNQTLAWLVTQGRASNISKVVEGCRKLKAMTKRQQIEVMDSLVYLGLVKVVEKPGGHSGRGQKTPWYVAVEVEGDE